MQKLTAKELKENARKYYEAGKLTAQHPVKAKRQCVYKMGSYRCAIGASLNDETLKQLDDERKLGSSVTMLNNNFSRIAFTTAAAIQYAHDEWASSARNLGSRNADTIELREKFKRRIGLAA